MEFAWKGKNFPTFSAEQISTFAPNCPVVYGLITRDKGIYVGATRRTRARLREQLTSPNYCPWLERLANSEAKTREMSDKDRMDFCEGIQLNTRWCIFQTFARDAFAEDIGIAEKAWIIALEPSLNSIENLGTYCAGPKRGLDTLQIENAVLELVPLLKRIEPWKPESFDFESMFADLCSNQFEGSKTVMEQKTVGAFAELVDLACYLVKKRQIPDDINFESLEKSASIAGYFIEQFHAESVSAVFEAQSVNEMEAA